MNEQLQNAVATILERAITGIDSSVEFMQAELPEVIEQLLMWYAVKSVVLTVIGCLVLFALLYADYLSLKYCKSEKSHLDAFEIMTFYGALGCIARIVYLIPISMMSLDWLQIWIAPKIWLMEYAASIVK
jgi:hypothetical protein